ncbi:hypothetical protein SDJN02_21994, partial [Cucurbita argyrosperma subsp. argyrosperma]
MEKGYIYGLKSMEEDEELKMVSSLPSIPQPRTPREPMEFLARTWRSFGKWFNFPHKEAGNSIVKKKDRARIENARVHSALSVTALAAALAAVAAAEKSDSKMGMALASATEILASHCIEMAEFSGADHEQNHWVTAFSSHMEEQELPCVGELLQFTRKGTLRWKEVSVYINKKSQRDILNEVYFGLKTAQGLLEFKCKNKIHKQSWVQGIQSLLHRVNCIETTRSLQILSFNESI